jgi:hypothetical protein
VPSTYSAKKVSATLPKKVRAADHSAAPNLFTELAQWVNLTSDDASLDLG